MQNLDSNCYIDIALISSSLTFDLIVRSLYLLTPKVAGAAVTTITNPQNLTSLFITHDFGLYPWSFCFMLGICVSRLSSPINEINNPRILSNPSKLHDVFHHPHLSFSSLVKRMTND
ncbi:hypothetical protein N7453_008640 [Penicillium expansum]|nr:hypothetical protein N7453_008640 [Penicillium expansum]